MPSYGPTTLLRPKDVDEAVKLLREYGTSARLVAGNTTIYELVAQGALVDIDCLIDITHAGLSYVKERENGISIGAATTFAEMARSPVLERPEYFAIKETAKKLTPPQVRNMGTLGGALCSGIPFYDMPTTMLALGARLRIATTEGERELNVEEFFLDYFMTAVSPEEILTEARVEGNLNTGTAFVKLGRTSSDFAVVNAAARVVLDSSKKRIEETRIALGAVANKPVRMEMAEGALEGKVVSKDVILRAAKEAATMEPTASIHASSDYKKRVIPVLVRDALLSAVSRAGGSAES
ncbi:MAG: FAD binding domain-containing protein [Thaumarchaeota archaeon]|nr:FAD binding domain-containing protein [Nitrososphaerota archaeon]